MKLFKTVSSFIKNWYYFYSVGGTMGAIFTCPLEVVKTRLQSSNSGFGSGKSTRPNVSTEVLTKPPSGTGGSISNAAKKGTCDPCSASKKLSFSSKICQQTADYFFKKL